MFDVNQFKRQVKDWIRHTPMGSKQELVDFCEENIPANQFAANQWLVEQTVNWYQQILHARQVESSEQDD